MIRRIVTKLFGDASPEELEGMRLQTKLGYWVLEGDTDLSTFLRALPPLISQSAFLYFEGGSPEGELKEWIDRNQVEPAIKIARGTIWPRCVAIHIPLTSETIAELAEISERIAHPELAIHLHVYELDRVILEWHDAFDNPLLIDPNISEEVVTDFAKAIKFTVTKQINS